MTPFARDTWSARLTMAAILLMSAAFYGFLIYGGWLAISKGLR